MSLFDYSNFLFPLGGVSGGSGGDTPSNALLLSTSEPLLLSTGQDLLLADA